MNTQPTAAERRHLALVAIAEGVRVAPHSCWEWQKSTREGYGRAFLDGRLHSAHVLSWEVFVGPVPDGKQINHTCHNRACCNPDHLYAGTQVENVADMYQANRQAILRGEVNGNSKVTNDTARAIYEAPGIARVIAEKYGVSISLVYAIKKRKVWRHLHEQQANN